jgi:D-arabinose 1-dehydrogenase-like Zn-dependent alcohol dehydrogenase
MQKLIPGHQIVGEIVEGMTTDLPLGTRVGVSWIGGVDGECPYCRRGLENLCDSQSELVNAVKIRESSVEVALAAGLPRGQVFWLRLAD